MKNSDEHVSALSIPNNFRDNSDYHLYTLSLETDGWENKLNWSEAELSHKKLTKNLQDYAGDLAVRSAHIEQLGLTAAAGLANDAPNFYLRINLARAIADEARHACVFAQYAQEIAKVPLNTPSTQLVSLAEEFDLKHKFVHRFFVHTLKENQALAVFKVLTSIFSNSFIGGLYNSVKSDEARHVSMGIRYLKQYAQQSDANRREFLKIEAETMSSSALTKEKAEDYARYSSLSQEDVWEIFQNTHSDFMKRIIDTKSKQASSTNHML